MSKLHQSNGDNLPPLDLYKLAVDEYRWQASHNWSRTQYLLAFNAGVLTAATAVATQGGRAAALVFVLGAVAGVLSVLAIRTQHDYYRAARDRMCRLEDRLGVPPDARVDTTSTLGQRDRLVSVQDVVNLLLAALVLASLVGFAMVVSR